MTRRVLVPVDDSEPSRAALRIALERHADDALTALHVVDSRALEGAAIAWPDGAEDAHALYVQRAERLLSDAETLAAQHDVELATDYVQGTPIDAIADYVEDNDVDHVVMGSHGRSGMSRVFLGSVTEETLRRVDVPVTVVGPEAASASDH